MTRLFLVALLLLVTPVTQAPPMGAAIVSGTVVTTDRPAVPVARAEITLSGGATGPTRKTLTDEAGAFRFDRVAVGQYTLTASKAGYATGSFGSTQSTAAGVPIVVSAGSALTGIVLELTRAGAISGVVRDRHGGPIARIDVQLLRLAFKQGARAAAPVGKPVTTDDRGQYRFSGLAPGEYFVSIPARFANYNFGGLRRRPPLTSSARNNCWPESSRPLPNQRNSSAIRRRSIQARRHCRPQYRSESRRGRSGQARM